MFCRVGHENISGQSHQVFGFSYKACQLRIFVDIPKQTAHAQSCWTAQEPNALNSRPMQVSRSAKPESCICLFFVCATSTCVPLSTISLKCCSVLRSPSRSSPCSRQRQSHDSQVWPDEPEPASQHQPHGHVEGTLNLHATGLHT